MTNEEIIAYQTNRRKFYEHEIGKLCHRYLQTQIRAHVYEGDSPKRIREITEEQKAAENAFIGRLMADYGII